MILRASALTKINGFDVLPFDARLIDRASGKPEPVDEAARELIDKAASTYAAVFSGGTWKEGWSETAAAGHLIEFLDKRRSMGFVIVDSDDKVAAFILGEFEGWDYGDRFHLWEWGVRPDMQCHPDTQRQGIGSQLLDYTIDAAYKSTAKRIVLDTTRGSLAELAFEHRGFVEVPGSVMMHLDKPSDLTLN